MHKSIATIEAPQFINLKPLDINPLMSSCEIKVLYIGENRNHSYITEEVASEMAKTLRGAPIVGYFKKDKEDFADHGNRMILDDEGIKFECLTRPYGFVSPDAKVWFQTFEDTDEFGNISARKYLMTTGYLWTGQYQECKLVAEEGRPHSMELDEETLDGYWAKNSKNDMEFFIINDAVFSKLCILGDDVEPCFEGSSVTAPNISSNFTKIDDEFKKTLFSMMQELQFALQGGQQMENEVKVLEETVEGISTVEVEQNAENIHTSAGEGATNAESVAEVENDFAASEKEEEEKADEAASAQEEEEKPEVDGDEKDKYSKEKEEEKEEETDSEEKSDAPAEKDEDEEKKQYSLLEEKFAALTEKYSNLEKEYKELVAFKAEVEDAKKDEMIKQFYFLTDEDKREVIENKSKYTLEEIEGKLSVICVRNKVNFNLENGSKNDINTEEPVVTTFTVSNEGPSIPAWITALKNNQKK